MIAITAEKRSALLEHKPQLDGARFCAVFVVLVYHHFSAFQGEHKFFDLTTFIVFFFVLSGYLITKILIIAKDVGLRQGQTRVNIAFDFLFRRTLRIFPAYYFYLIMIMVLLPVGGMYLRNHAAMFFLYLSNFQMYADQFWGQFATPHLWTLAVEEQFYVGWPWLILFIPNKHLPKLFYVLIASGILYRFFFYIYEPSAATKEVPYTILTLSCLDGFGFGALLAYQHIFKKAKNPVLTKIFYAIIPVYVITSMVGTNIFSISFGRVFVAIFAMFCIEGSVNGFKNWFGRFLQSKPIVYMGKISYGIYLYHLFASLLFWRGFEKVSIFCKSVGLNVAPFIKLLALPLFNFVLYTLITVGLASASWYLLERPANRLRRRITNAVIQKDFSQKN